MNLNHTAAAEAVSLFAGARSRYIRLRPLPFFRSPVTAFENMNTRTPKPRHSAFEARTKLVIGLVATLGLLPARGQQLADHFNDRLPLSAPVFSTLGTNTLATTDPGEQANRSVTPVRTLWVRWTAPANGYALVTSSNSPSRTVVNAWDYHKVLNELQQIPIQNNSGLPTALDRFEFNAISAADYNLVVDGRDGDKGVVQLDLKLYTNPEILMQPADVTVTAGQRTNLWVTALGNFPLTNQWQHSTFSFSTGFTNLPGGVDPQFTLGTSGVVSKSDEGWYRVTIKNEYGAVTSSVAYVEVNECAIPNPPRPASVVTNVGKTVVFSASAFGSQPFSYQWQFRPVGQVGFVDVPGATSSDLELDDVSTDDAGDYRFLVSNVACSDQVSTNVTLTVTTNNALVLDPTMPVDSTRITNQNASFSVRVTEGYQPIGYQWWFSPPSGPTNPVVGETAPDLFLNAVHSHPIAGSVF